MEQGFMNMERNMANQFRDLPRRMHEMADRGGESQSQSFSSSFESGMGQDGKMHEREQKQGSKVQCHQGKCKETICKNGECHERSYEQKTSDK